MKRILFFIFLFSGLTSFAKDKLVSLENTPSLLQVFVKKHFPAETINYIEKDKNYDVKLTNGTELEFNRKGEWVEIDSEHNEMPQTVIDLLPQNAKTYLSDNYKDLKVKKISKEHNGYKVDLRTKPDVELKFDKNGNFKRFDD